MWYQLTNKHLHDSIIFVCMYHLPMANFTRNRSIKNWLTFYKGLEVFQSSLPFNGPLRKIPKYSLFVPPEFCVNIVSSFSWD